MTHSWRIHKVYTDAGIRWEGSLRNSTRTWMTVTPWGDEAALEQRLIFEWAESVLGPVGDLQGQHIRCGATDETRGIERLILERPRAGTVGVIVENGDRSAAIRELLALAVLASDRAQP